MFWHYIQSIPGGRLIIEDKNITKHVIIEANTPREANTKAKSIGMFFNVVECPCCDYRWELLHDNDVDLGSEIPMIFDEPVHESTDKSWINDNVIIHYMNGTVERTKVKKKGDISCQE